jgi:hypothetical protein
LAKQIWIFCQENQIKIEEVIYIPSEENIIADKVSRGKFMELQDWRLPATSKNWALIFFSPKFTSIFFGQ